MTARTSTAPASRRARARAAWAALRERLRAVSPGDVGSLALTVLLVAAMLWLAVASWPALLPFVFGALAAYTVLPVVNLLDRLMPRPLAALLVVLGLFALLAELLYLLVPALAAQVLRLYRAALTPDALTGYQERLAGLLSGLPEPSRSLLEQYVDQVNQGVSVRFERLIAGLAEASVASLLGVVGTLSTLIGILVLPLWMVGLLIGQRSAVPALRRVLPDWIEADVLAIVLIINRSLNAFLRGQLLLGLAVGVTMYAEVALIERYTAVDFRYPVLIALLAALLQLIPQVGPLLGVVLFGVLGLAASPQLALLTVALYVLAQVLVSQLVAGRVQRRLNDLNPVLLVLFIAALSQFGLVWALVSAPLLAIARDLVRYAYGRMAEPPRPAGVLPGDQLPVPRAAPNRSRGPAYRRRRAGGHGAELTAGAEES